MVTELLPPLVSATGQTLSCNDIKLSITITKSKYLKKKKRSLTLFAWCFVSFWGADKWSSKHNKKCRTITVNYQSCTKPNVCAGSFRWYNHEHNIEIAVIVKTQESRATELCRLRNINGLIAKHKNDKLKGLISFFLTPMCKDVMFDTSSVHLCFVFSWIARQQLSARSLFPVFSWCLLTAALLFEWE